LQRCCKSVALFFAVKLFLFFCCKLLIVLYTISAKARRSTLFRRNSSLSRKEACTMAKGTKQDSMEPKPPASVTVTGKPLPSQPPETIGRNVSTVSATPIVSIGQVQNESNPQQSLLSRCNSFSASDLAKVRSTCKVCSAEYDRFPVANRAHYLLHFCSAACSKQHTSEHGGDAAAYKRDCKAMTCKCVHCQADYDRFPVGNWDRHRTFFCSPACATSHFAGKAKSPGVVVETSK